jgi:thioesterase domain-containing protein
MQRAFHLTIAPDTIYRNPTIRQQALMIARKTGNHEHYHPLIVPIHEGGTLPPLFCFHPLGGWIGKYQEISPFFDKGRPVFGIRSKGFDAAEKPSLTIQEAVRDYADAIKTVQKEGPYHLMGYSAGAIYAFELACLFQSRGDQVTFLGIIDQSVPSPQRQLFNLTKGQGSTSVTAAGYHLYRFMRNRLKTNPESLSYSLFVKGAGIFSRGLLLLTSFTILPVSKPDDNLVFGGEKDRLIAMFPEEQHALVRIQMRALQKYQPRTFSGDLTLFSTGPDAEFYPGDLTRGWNSCITGKTRVVDVPGNHENLFFEPNGKVVAQKIEESLKRVDAHG